MYAYCADYVTSKPSCDNDISVDHLSSTCKIVSSIDIPYQHMQDNSESNLSYDIAAEAYSTLTCQLVVDDEKKNVSVAVIVVGTEGGEEVKSGGRKDEVIFQINNPLITERTNQLAEMMNSIQAFTNDTITSIENKLSAERNTMNIYQFASSEINHILVNIIDRVKQVGYCH
ncbi:unnamed protein product [Trichobilharzia regenti]|nr:unnamed protein product [Trichobilharzia regenti]